MRFQSFLQFIWVSLLCFLLPTTIRAAGVTLVTHGFNGEIDGWVLGMAGKMPTHPGFPGTDFTCYEIEITSDGSGGFVATAVLLEGANPLESATGEVFVKLDWSSLSTTGGVGTDDIAAVAATALQSTNLIAALEGRALCELPLHLIGHSRGASLVLEMSRFLGAQGIWVDQVTALDPVPVGLFGDPSVRSYANILFIDNYWQNEGDGLFVPNGQAIAGAYNRKLTILGGGYSSEHSDAHLWYHGTVDHAVPTSDLEASLTSAQRSTWWTAAEQGGTNAGFHYSRIGGGDRLGTLEPNGAGNGRIRDGYNQMWDLGAGVSPNRDPLPSNNGAWPNVIAADVVGTSEFRAGDLIPVSFSYQFGANSSAAASARLLFDPDDNPWNSNHVESGEVSLAGTGPGDVITTNFNLSTSSGNPAPGIYSLFVRVEGNGHTRYLATKEKITILAPLEPVVLTGLGFEGDAFKMLATGQPDQTFVLQATVGWLSWTNLSTNTLVGSSLELTDPEAAGMPQRFYRVLLVESP